MNGKHLIAELRRCGQPSYLKDGKGLRVDCTAATHVRRLMY